MTDQSTPDGQVEQGSPEWFAQRCGKVTASRIVDVMARTKTGYSASRSNYMAQLICERLTGTVAPSFTNDAMRHGTETEPEARRAYEAHADVDVKLVPMIDHPHIANAGASPDGLVGDCGLVEIKCPQTATHIETLLGAAVPDKYVKQMHFQMMCTKRLWCDFVSYDPRLPERMRLFVKRFDLDPGLVRDIEAEVQQFLTELDTKIEKLKELHE